MNRLITITVMRLIYVCAGCATISVLAAPVTFPGIFNRSADPTGRFEIRWAEASGSSAHELLFAAVGSANAIPFLAFDRSVTVHWSPKGDRFAVTDHNGSDNSEVLVFTVPPTQPINVQYALPQSIRKLIQGNHHAYVEATAWNVQGLAIHVHGYGDTSPKGFSVGLQCNVHRDTWNCR